MERYLMILKSIKRMNIDLEQTLRENVYPTNISKGYILSAKPGLNDNLYFIEKGIFHCYYLKFGLQLSMEFRCEDEFLNMIESFNGIERDPNLEIEALEEATVWCFPAALVKDLFEKHMRFCQQYTEIATRDYVAQIKASKCSRPGNAAHNWKQLSELFPKWLQRVPIKLLSNFTQMPEKQLVHLLQSHIKLNTDTKRRHGGRRRNVN